MTNRSHRAWTRKLKPFLKTSQAGLRERVRWDQKRLKNWLPMTVVHRPEDPILTGSAGVELAFTGSVDLIKFCRIYVLHRTAGFLVALVVYAPDVLLFKWNQKSVLKLFLVGPNSPCVQDWS